MKKVMEEKSIRDYQIHRARTQLKESPWLDAGRVSEESMLQILVADLWFFLLPGASAYSPDGERTVY